MPDWENRILGKSENTAPKGAGNTGVVAVFYRHGVPTGLERRLIDQLKNTA